MKLPRAWMAALGLLALLWLGAAQALPTVDEVQAAARRGDYAAAETMMREVVTARPDSARAHYVLAEILAHRRQLPAAVEHTRRARALDPALRFTDPARFNSFEQALQREQAAAAKAALPAPLETRPAPAPAPRAAPESAAGDGVPVWLWGLGAVLLIGVVVRVLRRRGTAMAAQPAMAGYGGPQGGLGRGFGGGMPQGPAAGGSGLMGMGMAAAGGVAAGMLAERLLHGGQDERGLPRDDASAGAAAGGLIPGSFDDGMGGAADELTRRDIDFGSGDGWGGGDLGSGDIGGDVGGGSGDW